MLTEHDSVSGHEISFCAELIVFDASLVVCLGPSAERLEPRKSGEAADLDDSGEKDTRKREYNLCLQIFCTIHHRLERGFGSLGKFMRFRAISRKRDEILIGEGGMKIIHLNSFQLLDI